MSDRFIPPRPACATDFIPANPVRAWGTYDIHTGEQPLSAPAATAAVLCAVTRAETALEFFSGRVLDANGCLSNPSQSRHQLRTARDAITRAMAALDALSDGGRA